MNGSALSQPRALKTPLLLVPFVLFYHGGAGHRPNIPRTMSHSLGIANYHSSLGSVAGGIVNGTTGSGHTMSLMQKVELMNAYGRAKQSGKLPSNFILIAGTGTADLDEALAIVTSAREEGFDAILTLPPPGDYATKKAFLAQIAKACGNDLDLILYHHPRLNAEYWISLELAADLMSEYLCIVGLKDSEGDEILLGKWRSYIRDATGRDALIAVGEDLLIASAISKHHAQAAIAGSGNSCKGLLALLGIFDALHNPDPPYLQRMQQALTREVKILLFPGKNGRTFQQNVRRRAVRIN